MASRRKGGMDVVVHVNGPRLEEDLGTQEAWKDFLDALGYAIVAHAVPHSGVDTGRLTSSMSHDVRKEEGVFVLVCGSGSSDGTSPVEYAEHHWADAKPGGGDRWFRGKDGGLRRIPAGTWKGRKPWTKALRELGIRAKRLNGYEV